MPKSKQRDARKTNTGKPAAPVSSTSTPNPGTKPETATPAPVSQAAKPEEKAPKWFTDFSGNWDKKHEEFDKRLKALEEKEKQRAEAEAKAKGAAATAASATADPKPAAPATSASADPAAAQPTKADPAPAAAATSADDKFAKGWHPAEAWKYRYWVNGKMRWGGPLLDILAAKAAGGGTRDGYEMIPVWVNADLQIMDVMTPEEIDKHLSTR